MDKPAIVRREARWLEAPDAALYLESARTLPAVVTAAGQAIGAELAAPLIGTFLYTYCSSDRPFVAAVGTPFGGLHVADMRNNKAWRYVRYGLESFLGHRIR
jgi:hypothetical protein